ncbi:MAG: pirin-like C-terminal cupin domain-containing protein, partial [Pseudomonadota bacterium]
LILGRAYGESAPVKVFQDMFYLDAQLTGGAKMPLPDDQQERAIYIMEGCIGIGSEWYEAGQMLVFREGDPITLAAGPDGAHIMLCGGEAMDGPRYIWWNFVASSKERIEAAKADWVDPERRAERFPLPPGDSAEFIPLPED